MKTLILTQANNDQSQTYNWLNFKNIAFLLFVTGFIAALFLNKLIIASAIILFGFPIYLVIKFCKEILSIVSNMETMFEDLEEVVSDLGM